MKKKRRPAPRRLYTCCPHAGCDGFRSALEMFRSRGIEPALRHSQDGHFFEFNVPKNWDLDRTRELNQAIQGGSTLRDDDGEGTKTDTACPACGAIGVTIYAVQHDISKVEFTCCGECITSGRGEAFLKTL